MGERVLNFTLNEEIIGFPEFVSTSTLPKVIVEPDWKKPEDVVVVLKKLDFPITSKVSLLNYERRGLLTAKRVSAKKVYYDLNEVIQLFKHKKK
jgi:hypothetical protein